VPGTQARQAACYRWLCRPVGDTHLVQAHRANALFDAHRDDPEFGHRLLADQARYAGAVMSDRTACRICADNAWWSSFGKRPRRGKGGKVGPPVPDDLVQRAFTACDRNLLWLTDIERHEALSNRVEVGDLHLRAVVAVWV